MKQSARAEALAPRGDEGCWVAGSYEAGDGLRIVRAVITAQHGLCRVEEGPDGSLLIERELEGAPQAESLASDYIEVAGDRGEPQTRLAWPPVGETSRSEGSGS